MHMSDGCSIVSPSPAICLPKSSEIQQTMMVQHTHRWQQQPLLLVPLLLLLLLLPLPPPLLVLYSCLLLLVLGAKKHLVGPPHNLVEPEAVEEGEDDGHKHHCIMQGQGQGQSGSVLVLVKQ
jgi:hypothetical protein